MKTCVKLHITSVLTLSSKISLSLNTKLMGKVKGKSYMTLRQNGAKTLKEEQCCLYRI